MFVCLCVSWLAGVASSNQSDLTIESFFNMNIFLELEIDFSNFELYRVPGLELGHSLVSGKNFFKPSKPALRLSIAGVLLILSNRVKPAP